MFSHLACEECLTRSSPSTPEHHSQRETVTSRDSCSSWPSFQRALLPRLTKWLSSQLLPACLRTVRGSSRREAPWCASVAPCGAHLILVHSEPRRWTLQVGCSTLVIPPLTTQQDPLHPALSLGLHWAPFPVKASSEASHTPIPDHPCSPSLGWDAQWMPFRIHTPTRSLSPNLYHHHPLPALDFSFTSTDISINFLFFVQTKGLFSRTVSWDSTILFYFPLGVLLHKPVPVFQSTLLATLEREEARHVIVALSRPASGVLV